MAKNQYAWSVRGVSREARTLAKNAARKRQVTTGEWVSLALITVADDELVVSPKSLLPLGPSPIALSVDDKSLNKMSARERALLALASKRPAPKGSAEREQQAPWSIRGVSQVARVKAAKVAAHRRVTIGEWVNHAIQVYAGREVGVEPATASQGQWQDTMTVVPEKTMRLVETLARHFDETRTADTPKATTPDTLREVEQVDPPRSPKLTPDITPDVSAAAAPGPTANDSSATEKKISELAYQVLGAERRNEQRLAALTEVLTNLANRLKISGDLALDGGQRNRNAPRDELEEDAAKLSKAEMLFWDSIKDSNDPDAYKSYLESFPDGLFVSLARRRASREAVEIPSESQSSPDASPLPLRDRSPPVYSVPKFDFDTLNKRAIENTKRKS